MFEAIISRLEDVDFLITFFIGSEPLSISYNPLWLLLNSNPKAEEAFPWGSASINRTFFSKTPRAADRLTDVVVFPTPPFWFATEIILPIF